MHIPRRRVSRTLFAIIEICAALVFFWVVLHHVYTFDFEPLAALCVPILVVFFGFASLLYNRGRALPKGRAQARSLYAAERTMQATIWYLFGIILGTSIYGFVMHFELSFDPSAPTPSGLWLLLFLAPYALMQMGLLYFMRAAWVITPQFFGRVGAHELRRRVQQ